VSDAVNLIFAIDRAPNSRCVARMEVIVTTGTNMNEPKTTRIAAPRLAEKGRQQMTPAQIAEAPAHTISAPLAERMPLLRLEAISQSNSVLEVSFTTDSLPLSANDRILAHILM
jgi:hypothetical protein